MNNTLSLSELVEGESGIVIGYDTNPPRKWGVMKRLIELGFIKNAEVSVECIVHSTYKIKIKGQSNSYGIGKELIDRIYVRKIE